MGVNIKYYIVTIVSIFLAIAVGISIGVVVDTQNLLESQKEGLVGQLEERFNYLKLENERSKDEVNTLIKKQGYLEDFNNRVYSEIIKDKLKDKKVAIIESNDSYVYSAVKETLEIAGANIRSVTTINDEILLSQSNLEDIYKEVSGSEYSGENILPMIMEDLSKELVNGKDIKLMQKLKSVGLINLIGDYDGKVDYVIIAGGSKDKADEKYVLIDKVIIETIKKQDTFIVGVEKENVEYSYVDNYINSRISSVDNIDSVIGKVSLVLLMNGSRGNYGVKSSSEAITPDRSNTPIDNQRGATDGKK